MRWILIAGLCAGAAITSPGWAADYKPVTCAAAAPYVGPPVHAPLPDSVFAVPAVPTTLSANTAARLDAAFAKARAATGAPAMTAAVSLAGGGDWTRTEAAAPSPAPLFYWASTGKAFTAVVVLQLVEEGKLSLDDPLSRWRPDMPNAKAITIRHLLDHTSGLFSGNEDLKLHRQGGPVTPEQDFKVSASHGAMFCPGQRWRYSNTGYGLLGRIIERVDGVPYDVAVRRRIVDRLGLKDLRALAPGEVPADVAPLAPSDPAQKPMILTNAYAAGGIVGRPEAMSAFWRGLLTGELLKPETVRGQFATLYPMFDPGTFYGLGVMVFDIPDGDRRILWLGHAGGAPGAGAVAFYAPDRKAFVSVALTGDGSAVATANLLLKALED